MAVLTRKRKLIVPSGEQAPPEWWGKPAKEVTARPVANMAKDLKYKSPKALASMMVQNALMTRTNLLSRLLDPPGRDLYRECGYPEWISPIDYRQMYDREGCAARVVDVMPEESWSMEPEVFEDDDEGTETEFEEAWEEFCKKLHVFSYLERVDKLSGIGSFGGVLFGLDDGLDLDQPAAGFNELGEETNDAEAECLYLRVFDESQIHVGIWETDQHNPRYGQPHTYLIRFMDYSTVPIGQTVTDSTTHRVHWTRFLHVADNRKSSEIFGVPRMQHVYNRLLDLRKLLGGSAEMFWKGAFPGYSFEVNPEFGDAEIDTAAVREEFERYSNGLQRYLAIAGLSAKSLLPQIADPEKHTEAQYKAIAMSIGVPWRVFIGSEKAQLASDQDATTWNKRVRRRQLKYLSPMLLRPFVQRAIALGCLPRPAEYHDDWPDLNSPDDTTKAQTALAQSQALAQYVSGNVQTIFPPLEYLRIVLGLSLKQAQAVVEAATAHIAALDDPNADPSQHDQPDAGQAIHGSAKEAADKQAELDAIAKQPKVVGGPGGKTPKPTKGKPKAKKAA